MAERTVAHLIDQAGVTDVPFDRNPDGSWSNAVPVSLIPGAVLELHGIRLMAHESFTFSYETHIELD